MREGIAAKSLHSVLDRIITLHGCVTCGLGGIDLRIRVQDALLIEKFQDIEGIQDVAWHSEHLGFTTVAGDFLGTMLTLPRTEAALDLVCTRILALRSRYRLPFLLEHVAQLLPEGGEPYTHARFVNEIVERTGCELIFDAYNLECDAFNGIVDAHEFMSELDFTKVREVHVAGGVERRGFKLDVHSRLCSEATLAQFELALVLVKACDTAEYRIRWPQDPNAALAALLEGDDPTNEQQPRTYLTIVSCQIAGLIAIVEQT